MDGAGRDHAKARENRYLSPSLTHTRDGVVLWLAGAASTNAPALDMPALASNRVPRPHEDQHATLGAHCGYPNTRVESKP